MRSRETPAKALTALDVRDLLGLIAWQAAQDEMEGASPDEAWVTHRHRALQHAHRCRCGDAHIHEGWEGRLGPATALQIGN